MFYRDIIKQGLSMKWNFTKLQTYLYFINAIILLAGLSSAILIYLTATNDSRSNFGYEVVGGYVYPSTSEYSKKYVHDLQLYGGNAAMLADEFSRWFAGLWQGKSLAFTVAFITIFISFAVFCAANNLPKRLKSDMLDERKRDETG